MFQVGVIWCQKCDKWCQEGVELGQEGVRWYQEGVRWCQEVPRVCFERLLAFPEYILKDSWQEAFVEHWKIRSCMLLSSLALFVVP